MPVFLAIALKDLRLLSRDRVGLFWVLVFPLIFAGFFGSVMAAGVEQKTAPLSVVVVQAKASPRTDTLTMGLIVAGLSVRTLPLRQAQEAVRRGEAVAYVQPSPEPGGPVRLGIDPARQAEAAMLRGLVLSSLASEYVPIMVQPPPIEAQSVVRARTGPVSGFEIVFGAMILWSLLGCAATFAIAIVSERASGTLLRLSAAPLSRASLVAGKASACLGTSLAAALLLTLIGTTVLDVRILQPGKYALALTASALCFSGLTMLLSVLGKTDQAVAGAGWSTLIVLAMLGGAMVPLTLMPEWLLGLSDVSPVKWSIRALEGATWRGDAWPELLVPVAGLSALGLLGLAFGTWALSGSRA